MEIEFTTLIELPVKVRANIQPEEKGGRHHPHIPMQVEDIKIRLARKPLSRFFEQVAESDWIAALCKEEAKEAIGQAQVDLYLDREAG